MAELTQNLNFIWFGDDCESCNPYEFYVGENIRNEFSDVLRVIDVKDGGYVYEGWSKDVHDANLEEYKNLPDLVKNTLGVNFIKNGQSFDRFECGRAYVVEIEEGSIVNIDGAFVANQNENPPRSISKSMPNVCPEMVDCECSQKTFIFKKFDLNNNEFEGWVDPVDACFENTDGVVYNMVLSTPDAVVGSKIYLNDRIKQKNFLEHITKMMTFRWKSNISFQTTKYI